MRLGIGKRKKWLKKVSHSGFSQTIKTLYRNVLQYKLLNFNFFFGKHHFCRGGLECIDHEPTVTSADFSARQLINQNYDHQ